MLVKFKSPRAAEFLMFEDIARRLIRSMGASGDVPGAIAAEDVPAALAKLRDAVARDDSAPAAHGRRDDEDDTPAVTLRQRALPLTQMLEAAVAGETYVMWEF